jgi:hypothetical protein
MEVNDKRKSDFVLHYLNNLKLQSAKSLAATVIVQDLHQNMGLESAYSLCNLLKKVDTFGITHEEVISQLTDSEKVIYNDFDAHIDLAMRNQLKGQMGITMKKVLQHYSLSIKISKN